MTVLLNVQPLPSTSSITEPSKHFALWSHSQAYASPPVGCHVCGGHSEATSRGICGGHRDKGKGFSPVLQFSPVSTIPPILHTSASRNMFPAEHRCPARCEYVFRKISRNQKSEIFITVAFNISDRSIRCCTYEKLYTNLSFGCYQISLCCLPFGKWRQDKHTVCVPWILYVPYYSVPWT